MGLANGQDRFCSTPKLSYPMDRAYETPGLGLATPPVNIAGSVPFLWEEAPGKPRASVRKPARSNQNRGVVRCLDLPPRLLLPGEATANEPSPTTVLDGPYDLRRRSLSLPRSASVIRMLRGVPAPAPAKEKRLSEGRFDFLSSRDGTKAKLYKVKSEKGSLFNLSHTTKSDFWARVYRGFRQVIPPWRRKHENLERMNSSTL